jgi:hypothetical protein
VRAVEDEFTLSLPFSVVFGSPVSQVVKSICDKLDLMVKKKNNTSSAVVDESETNTTIDWEDECELPRDISDAIISGSGGDTRRASPPTSLPPSTADYINRAFLTGSTGFLGIYVLQQYG